MRLEIRRIARPNLQHARPPGRLTRSKKTPTTRHAILRRLIDDRPELRSCSGDDVDADLAAAIVDSMPAVSWTALQVVAGIDGARAKLCIQLLQVARRGRDDRRWPARLRRRPCHDGRAPAGDYVPDLVALAALDLAKPERFTTPRARAAWFGISEREWQAVVRGPYDSIAGTARTWLEEGLRCVRDELGERFARNADCRDCRPAPKSARAV